jgi:hypothetical protein
MRSVALWIADTGPALVMLTWSVLLIEFGLAAGLVAAKRWWPLLLCAGMALHGGIILIHGLVSFGMIMMGALVLYLRPKDRPFVVPHWMLARAPERWQRRRAAARVSASARA